MKSSKQTLLSQQTWLIPILFVFARFIFYLGMVSGNLFGFGDVDRYFELAALNGWPFFSYWMEYPPIFAFISTIVYHLAGGQQIVYQAILYFIFSFAGAVTLYIFQELDKLILPDDPEQSLRAWVYTVFLLAIPYSWWYFEMLPVSMMLIAIYLTFKKKVHAAGVWVGLGILTKWFPGLILPALWRLKQKKVAIWITSISIGMTILVYAILWALSPTMTTASLVSQPTRNSWCTIWAWIDGNYMNGAFANPPDHYDPAYVTEAKIGNPPKISPLIRLVVFALIGLFFWLKTKDNGPMSILALMGITWALFLIWSSGWSPQWILFLIPLIFLTFPLEKSLFLNLLLSLLTLMEWPTLLGHRLYIFLGPIVLLRTIFLIYLIFAWYRNHISGSKSSVPVQAATGM
jgi:hypothetical protein